MSGRFAIPQTNLALMIQHVQEFSSSALVSVRSRSRMTSSLWHLFVLFHVADAAGAIASFGSSNPSVWITAEADVVNLRRSRYHDHFLRRGRAVKSSSGHHGPDRELFNGTSGAFPSRQLWHGSQLVLFSPHLEDVVSRSDHEDEKNPELPPEEDQAIQSGAAPATNPARDTTGVTGLKSNTISNSARTPKNLPVLPVLSPLNYHKAIRTLVFSVASMMDLGRYKRFCLSLRAHYAGDVLLFTLFEGAQTFAALVGGGERDGREPDPFLFERDSWDRVKDDLRERVRALERLQEDHQVDHYVLRINML